ncbi:elongation factor P [Porphyrobacter sp. TH134]|uniref:elongation factor P n=1 Tax=Porphyrobacter sp. TH134 TaxID=2067450 RepID=UPI000C7B88A8|nr:elongation factor P [Porphyrobacter sp. TH134]PLK24683.1 elongation factor P [Porphyrobacter sp. TH134]
MKTRYIFLLIVSAAATAAFLPGGAEGQDRNASRPQSRVGAPVGGLLGILQHGDWQCALPGDAGGEAFVDVPAEAFRIGTASSYLNAAGTGIYLLRGADLVFTRGPKKDERFRVLGENTMQKLNPDGSDSKLICTRVSNGN